MSKIQFIVGLCLISCFVGCVAQHTFQEKEVPIIKVDQSIEEMSPEKMAEHFTNDRYVVLKGVMLTDIDRLIDWGDRFVALDRRGQQTVIFDTEGKCIRQIKRQGKGPGEYIQLSDCTIDPANNELILYADQPGKLIWFDREGNYLREERWTANYFNEVMSVGDDLYVINGGEGRCMADKRIVRMTLKNGLDIEEFQLPHKNELPNMSAGVRLRSNGTDVWLSLPFDYTLYNLDTETKQFYPCYKLDLGAAGVPEEYVTLESTGRQLRENGFVYHVTEVNLVAGYLFFRTTGTGFYMMDTVSRRVEKLGAIPVCGLKDFVIAGYGLLENQKQRIVHVIPVAALLMWSESVTNEGNVQFEELITDNEEFMNPILLFQNVR